MFEVPRKEISGEVPGIPNDEAVVASTPRNDVVGCRILHKLISLSEEWWRACVMNPLHGLRSIITVMVIRHVETILVNRQR